MSIESESFYSAESTPPLESIAQDLRGVVAERQQKLDEFRSTLDSAFPSSKEEYDLWLSYDRDRRELRNKTVRYVRELQNTREAGTSTLAVDEEIVELQGVIDIIQQEMVLKNELSEALSKWQSEWFASYQPEAVAPEDNNIVYFDSYKNKQNQPPIEQVPSNVVPFRKKVKHAEIVFGKSEDELQLEKYNRYLAELRVATASETNPS